ncbi:MAG: outer membrane lipoprotein-sorting protein [Spirochaetia bacterium]
MKRIVLILIIGALATVSGFTQSEPDFQAILNEIDEMQNFEDTDFSCTYRLVSEKPGEETSVTEVRIFRRDAEDKMLMLFLQPEVQRGQGYLRLGENVWFYDPESRQFAHSTMRENIQDSEARNSDLSESSLSEDYEIISSEEGTLGRHDVWILTLEANNDEVAYPVLKMWIRRDNNLLLMVEEYSLSERLLRTSVYPSYTQVGDHYIPSRMLFIDNLREGERTQVSIGDISLGEIPDNVFTKAYLERVSR